MMWYCDQLITSELQKIVGTIFFSIELWFFDIQSTFYLIVKGLKNAFFMSLIREGIKKIDFF